LIKDALVKGALNSFFHISPRFVPLKNGFYVYVKLLDSSVDFSANLLPIAF